MFYWTGYRKSGVVHLLLYCFVNVLMTLHRGQSPSWPLQRPHPPTLMDHPH